MPELYDFLNQDNTEPLDASMLKIVPSGFVADFDEYNYMGLQQPKFQITYDQMRKIVEKNTWIESAIRRVCDTMGTLGFQIVPDVRYIPQYRKDKTMRIMKTYIEQLFLMQTGTFVDFSSMIKSITRDIMTLDAACIEVVRIRDDGELRKLGITQTDRKGRIVSLHPRDPAGIYIDHDEHQIHRRYVQVGINARQIMPYDDNNPVFTMDVSGSFAVFDRHDMIYIRMYPRSGSAYGTPPVLSLLGAVQADYAADATIAKFMASGGVLPGVFNIEQTLDPNVVKRYTEAFKRIQTAGKNEIPIISGAGAAQFIPIAANGRESERNQLQQYYMKKILAMYGVPPHILGLTDGVNRGIAFAQTDTYMANAINPIKTLLENIFTERIVKEFHPGLRFEFTEGNALDWNTRYQRAAQLKQDGMIDEATQFVIMGQEPPSTQTNASLMEDINLQQAKINLELAKVNLIAQKKQLKSPPPAPGKEEPEDPMETVSKLQDKQREEPVNKAQEKIVSMLGYVHPEWAKALGSTSLTSSEKLKALKPDENKSHYERDSKEEAAEYHARKNAKNKKVLVENTANDRSGA